MVSVDGKPHVYCLWGGSERESGGGGRGDGRLTIFNTRLKSHVLLLSWTFRSREKGLRNYRGKYKQSQIAAPNFLSAEELEILPVTTKARISHLRSSGGKRAAQKQRSAFYLRRI